MPGAKLPHVYIQDHSIVKLFVDAILNKMLEKDAFLYSNAQCKYMDIETLVSVKL